MTDKQKEIIEKIRWLLVEIRDVATENGRKTYAHLADKAIAYLESL